MKDPLDGAVRVDADPLEGAVRVDAPPQEPSWLASVTTEPLKRIFQTAMALPGAAYQGARNVVGAARQIDPMDVLRHPSQLGEAAVETGKDIGKGLAAAGPELIGGGIGAMSPNPLVGIPLGAGGGRYLWERIHGTPQKEAATQGITSAGLQGAAQALPSALLKGTATPKFSKQIAYESAGVKPTLGDLTGGRLAQQSEGIAGRSLLGSGRVQKVQGQQLEDLAGAVKGTVDEMGGVKPRIQLGEDVAGAVERRLARSKAATGAAEKRLISQYGKVDIPRTNLNMTIDKLLGDIAKAEPAEQIALKGTVKFLKQLKQGGLSQPLEQWRSTNTFLGKAARSPDLTPNVEKGRLQALFKAHMQDLEQAPGLGQDAAKLVKRIKESYKENVIGVEDTKVGKLAKGQMEPEAVGSIFTKEGITPLLEAKKYAPGQFTNIRNRGFVDMLKKADALDLDTGMFKPHRFQDVWRKIDTDVKTSAFTTDEITRLDQLASIADDLGKKGVGKQTGQGSNLPYWQAMSIPISEVMRLWSGGGLGTLLPAAAFVGMPAAAAQVTTRPSLIKWLTTPASQRERMMLGGGEAVSNRGRQP